MSFKKGLVEKLLAVSLLTAGTIEGINAYQTGAQFNRVYAPERQHGSLINQVIESFSAKTPEGYASRRLFLHTFSSYLLFYFGIISSLVYRDRKIGDNSIFIPHSEVGF